MTAAASSPSRQPATPPRAGRTTSYRAPPQRRFVPDDSFFTARYELLDDFSTTDAARSLKARAMLPTPVEPKDCTSMWIPAARLTSEHNFDEILQSLNSDSQPATWKEHRASIRNFVRIPRQGISFVCTSDAALHSLGGLQLRICDVPVTIRKYSKYFELKVGQTVFVDLTRLPGDARDSDIYDWFTERNARPVLITPTFVAGELKSRDRMVYFNDVSCPRGLFTEAGEPIRKIFFVPDDKPCFVQHRMRKYNRTKPLSLRKPARDDAERMSVDETSGTSDNATRTSTPALALTPTPATTEPDAPVASVAPSGSSLDSLATRASSSPPEVKTRAVQLATSLDPTRFFISKVITSSTTDWERVKNARRGILTNLVNDREDPDTSTSCELLDDVADPSALTYSIPIEPTMYDVLRWDSQDTTLPPDIDMEVKDEAFESYAGFTADTKLVNHAAAAQLMETRRVINKETHMSAAELDVLIQEFVERDMQHFTSHDDMLAAVQAQPSYFRRIFKMATSTQTKLFKTHAVYRGLCSIPRRDQEPDDFLDRLKMRDPTGKGNPAKSFKLVFPEKDAQEQAVALARSDLFFMVFSPGIYFDPLKVLMLQQQQAPAKRLRNTPFLLWSDVNLTLWAQQDVARNYIDSPRTPSGTRKALKNLAISDLKSADTAIQSCLVRAL